MRKVIAKNLLITTWVIVLMGCNSNKEGSLTQEKWESEIDTSVWQKNEKGGYTKKIKPCNIKDNGLKAFDKVNFCISYEDYTCLTDQYHPRFGNCEYSFYVSFINDSLSEFSLSISDDFDIKHEHLFGGLLQPNIEPCRDNAIDLLKSVYGLPKTNNGEYRWDSNYKIIILTFDGSKDKFGKNKRNLTIRFMYKPFVQRKKAHQKNVLELDKQKL